MAEQLAKTNHPIADLVNAYEQWAQGGWGCILTGMYGLSVPCSKIWLH